MTADLTADLLELLSSGAAIGSIVSRGRGQLWRASVLAAFAAVSDTVISLLWALVLGNSPLATVWGVLAGIWAYMWWRNRNRRNRRRVRKLLGAKARALLAAVVRKMPKPSPPRQLAPQGA